jgi:hypothetical protein
MKIDSCRKSLFLLLICLGGTVARADEVANLALSFQKESFPEGWAYLWNPSDELGKATKYKPLKPTPEDTILYWTPDGTGLIPQQLSGYLFMGAQTSSSRVRGHAGAPGVMPQYAIFAYTLSAPGTYSITESILVNAAGEAASGLILKVLVNDTEIISRSTPAGAGQIDFDTKLGELKAGDVVYVAIGSGAESTADIFDVQFSIYMD